MRAGSRPHIVSSSSDDGSGARDEVSAVDFDLLYWEIFQSEWPGKGLK